VGCGLQQWQVLQQGWLAQSKLLYTAIKALK
jgi:hypothetical protein